MAVNVLGALDALRRSYTFERNYLVRTGAETGASAQYADGMSATIDAAESAIKVVREMLEALKSIQIASMMPVLPDGKHRNEAIQAALLLVERAIAKAEDAT